MCVRHLTSMWGISNDLNLTWCSPKMDSERGRESKRYGVWPTTWESLWQETGFGKGSEMLSLPWSDRFNSCHRSMQGFTSDQLTPKICQYQLHPKQNRAPYHHAQLCHATMAPLLQISEAGHPLRMKCGWMVMFQHSQPQMCWKPIVNSWLS